MFLQKARDSILRTRSNLYSKKIVSNPLCPIYERHKEIVMHAPWSSPFASVVWAENLSLVQKWVTVEEGFLEMWDKLMWKFKRDEMEWIAISICIIWLRNRFICQNQFYRPRKVIQMMVIQMTREGMKHFQSAQVLLKGIHTPAITSSLIKCWKKLDINVVKAN